jgi:hypothetical protein
MKLNHVRNSGGAKLFLAMLLAACFVATSAQADSFINGKFTLTNKVYWGKALLAPGPYTLSVERNTQTIVIRDASTGKVVAREMAQPNYSIDARSSELIVAVEGHQRAVSSLQLANVGELFNSAHPFAHIGRAAEEARKAEVVPVELAKK